jgi:pimeloyl-ACP methyl ester carboxylesterase
MVHGLATNMAFWYFHYAALFARRYRSPLYDLRGHGRSEMPPGGYTPDNLARDLEGLLDHLSIRRAHFLVHSFGGVIALNLARVAPERIASLVLADTHISAARCGAARSGTRAPACRPCSTRPASPSTPAIRTSAIAS